MKWKLKPEVRATVSHPASLEAAINTLSNTHHLPDVALPAVLKLESDLCTLEPTPAEEFAEP